MSVFNEYHAKSIKGFTDFIEPWIEEFCKFKVVSSVENLHNSGISQLLDMRASLDYLIQDTDETLYGLASRVHYQNKSYNNFTVRATGNTGQLTEYTKLYRSINRGGLLPKYTVSAFIRKNGSAPIAVAMTQTTDVVYAISKGHAEYRETNSGCNNYYVVSWEKLIQNNALMWVTNFETKQYNVYGINTCLAA